MDRFSLPEQNQKLRKKEPRVLFGQAIRGGRVETIKTKKLWRLLCNSFEQWEGGLFCYGGCLPRIVYLR